MATVNVVWHDMIDDKDKESSVELERHRERCELIGSSIDSYTFKDEEGVVFTIMKSQLIKMGD